MLLIDVGMLLLLRGGYRDSCPDVLSYYVRDTRDGCWMLLCRYCCHYSRLKKELMSDRYRVGNKNILLREYAV